MARQQTIIRPKRGEDYLANFDLATGAEIQRTRPALIVQNDITNRYSPSTIVAAIISQFSEPLSPTEVLIQSLEGGLTSPSVMLLNQIRFLEKHRLVRRLGMFMPATMARVDRAVLISLGLVAI